MNATERPDANAFVPPQLPTDRATTVDVQSFIDERPLSATQWLAVGLCFLIVFLDGLDTAAMGFVAPALAAAWGITRANLGGVMSAALAGLSIGALITGPLADRFGRKTILIASVLTFGLFSLLTAWADSMGTLITLRLLTGLGLGAAMPNATTLTSEFSPRRRRSLLVTVMFCGFTLGSAAGGFIAAKLIPAFGWAAMFILGGMAPLLLIPVLMLALPESPRFLAVRGQADRVAKMLGRIAGTGPIAAERFVVPEHNVRHDGSMVANVLGRERIGGTLLLWVTYFMGLMVVYSLTSWLPTLLGEAGFSTGHAATVTALFQMGGTVSAIGVGWAMDRFNPHGLIASFYALAGLSVFLTARSSGSVTVLGAMVLATGFFTSGAQTSMSALAARFYPTQGRATGVAWMLGIGRFGAILGAFSGAYLSSWGVERILTALALPALIAAATVTAKGLFTARDA
ncbi:aromatic acid/H+ symport family MFS transporter [Stigmatella aurantiaca]|uniref:4-hydroxybenzoate transporter n=1 Tax=Stigmatella aurantiaca (strain DW4/3-1) TaxID=378806 RepID=Q08UA9_STIAD|nr:aromatic acid/H+ symport family MFS transporter [Stigmatella aurantiaca]ADO69138.1 4-hydroxybenzoate transporter [Stigmatella aurantiaca DW4/3-1]EAU64076.1 4-hydroxybenzoate transporter [Stigmatella aurantiaca DW4/3-1]